MKQQSENSSKQNNAGIVVKKPTESERNDMLKHEIWESDITEFEYYYEKDEYVLMLEGEVTVEFDGGSVTFGAGDYVFLPKGLSCVWKVTKPVKEHFVFI